ncbi:MAG: hypothetical protein KDD82_09310 [Planctomycetes bacterium]|nr:hypothetical protein [Planctomycetota bacterium]
MPPAAETALSLAYADPPYPGKAYLYRGHPDYAGEVDHRKLLVDLSSYDGWALSTSSDGLLSVVAPLVAELGIEGVRVASWHRGTRRSPGARIACQGWEAVVYRGGRRVDPAGVSDALEYVARPRLSDPDRVIGAKPAAFCYWLFRLLGARRGDELHDLFPGSGGVSRAWAHFVSPGT